MDDTSVTGAIGATTDGANANAAAQAGAPAEPANPETVLERIRAFFSGLAADIEHDEQALVAWAKAHL